MYKFFPAVLISFLLSSYPSFAGIENRPLNSDEATILEKGAFAIPTGITFVKQPNDDQEWRWVTDFEYGLMDWFEVDVEIPYLFLDFQDEEAASDENGLGDIISQVELAFLKESEPWPAASLAFAVKLPSGDEDRGLGTGETDYTLTVLMSKTFGKFFVHVNLGVTFVGDPPDADLDNTFNANLALEYELTGEVMIVGEIFGQTNQDPEAEDPPLEGLLGLVFTPFDFLALDLGLGAGLTDESPDLRVTLGATLAF